ncbi:MAG TPA: YifB family Mg chelatase-like AAA ATPase [Candidatus Paceibacterota bacterium]|nr:YifB family Mg chelatase-like AAA ATPase [Candidatus Paceibacterota bacterium]
MSFSRTSSFQVDAGGAHLVQVDVDNHGKEFHFNIVGLGDKAVAESKERVLSALRNTRHFNTLGVIGNMTISLAPAELPKHGPAFDLPIAIGVLKSTKTIRGDTNNMAFIGELGLDGTIRPIRGALAAAHSAARLGITELFVPKENEGEAALVQDVTVYGAHTLDEIARHLAMKDNPARRELIATTPTTLEEERPLGESYIDIKGQETAKRGLLIAAAGGHNIALYGPPGTGKTLLARAVIELLPQLSKEKALETTMIHSLAGTLRNSYIAFPPFRSPHHTASAVAIIGGGPQLRPGEITLAHNGVLFLDEFPEFNNAIIEALREPLEEGYVRIARAKGVAQYPTRFILVAAMNPCPCGFAGDTKRLCTCQPSHLARYRRKLSGPIVDRIDMWIEVPRVNHEELLNETTVDKGILAELRDKVKRAHQHAERRQGEGCRNAHLRGADLTDYAPLSSSCRALLAQSALRLNLSGRALHRTIRLARTIADLECTENIEEKHILEALSYRPKFEQL